MEGREDGWAGAGTGKWRVLINVHLVVGEPSIAHQYVLRESLTVWLYSVRLHSYMYILLIAVVFSRAEGE